MLIGVYSLMVQVRSGKSSRGLFRVSIKHGINGKRRPYREDTCDLLIGYDYQAHRFYCLPTWQRRVETKGFNHDEAGG